MAGRSHRAARALAHLPETDPSLAALALWCETKDGDEIHTYTSQDSIHIGSGFESLPLHEQIGLLGHHVLHVALRHEARALSMQARFGAAFDAAGFNLCADALINSCLIASEHALPRPAVTLTDVLDLTTHDTPAQQLEFSAWDVETLYIALTPKDQDGLKNAENYMKEKRFTRDLRARSTPQQTESKSAEWQAHLKRAAQNARATGRGVGLVLARLSEVTASATPWEVHLRGILARALLPNQRPTYKRPRAAWIAADAHARTASLEQPVFQPGLERFRLYPRIVLGVDTSGSISRPTLNLFASEITGIANKTNAEIHVLCFDDAVYASQKITSADVRTTLENIDFRREGGTSYDDVFTQADAIDASILVVLTDLAATVPKAPKTHVIWAAHGLPQTPPSFGFLVDIRG